MFCDILSSECQEGRYTIQESCWHRRGTKKHCKLLGRLLDYYVCQINCFPCFLFLQYQGVVNRQYEDIPFVPPGEKLNTLYDQLADKKCIEIPRAYLKLVPSLFMYILSFAY